MTTLWILSAVLLLAFFAAAMTVISNYANQSQDGSTSNPLVFAAFVQFLYLFSPALFMGSMVFAGLALLARAIDFNQRRLAPPAAPPADQQVTPHELSADAQVITQPTPQRDEPIDHSVFMRPPSDG